MTDKNYLEKLAEFNEFLDNTLKSEKKEIDNIKESIPNYEGNLISDATRRNDLTTHLSISYLSKNEFSDEIKMELYKLFPELKDYIEKQKQEKK
ncbi:MAG: hypothetical protein Q8Q04_03640 [archaeon]|nr:hypothetical protein [archaeon]